jgi:hypothetical protein
MKVQKYRTNKYVISKMCLTGNESESSSIADESSGQDDGAEGDSDCIDTEEEEDADLELLENKDKFLIFTTGSKTFTPHQIGKYEYIAGWASKI